MASRVLATIILATMWAPAGAEPAAVPNVAPGQQSPAKSTQAATASPPAESGAVEPGVPAPPVSSPTSPPMTPKAREAAHIERLDSLIAPLSKYDLPADDAPRIKGAIEALAANKPEKAAELAKDVSDPIGRKLIAWYRLRQGQGEARDYLAFLDANPDWPSRDYLRQRMEEAL
ncbi:MAG: hypothetical protein ACXWJS_06605, partial [Hyphomicrobium sp.]